MDITELDPETIFDLIAKISKEFMSPFYQIFLIIEGFQFSTGNTNKSNTYNNNNNKKETFTSDESDVENKIA